MNTTKTRIFFRADGNNEIGLGHVFRCLALIDMLKNDFECIFIIRQPNKKISEVISSYCAINQLQECRSMFEEIEQLKTLLNKNDILVIDGYVFDENYQKKMKLLVHKLVAIDDKAILHFYVDLIINHGDSSFKNKYNTESYTEVLTGFQYLMMRKEFLDAAKNTRRISKIETVFICLGGSDPFNITTKAFRACIESDFIKRIIIITGSIYNNKVELNSLIEKAHKDKSILHEQNVTATRMVELMMMSEIAISPASSISLELCSVKAGLLTGTVIDNQFAIHQQLVNSECCISLGDFKTVSVEEINSYLLKLNNVSVVNAIMQKQSQEIDGLSGERILQEFKKLAA